jgi:hypothetical protein
VPLTITSIAVAMPNIVITRITILLPLIGG